MELVLVWMFLIFIVFLICIGVMRWAFRVNHICNKLDRIASLLESGKDPALNAPRDVASN